MQRYFVLSPNNLDKGFSPILSYDGKDLTDLTSMLTLEHLENTKNYRANISVDIEGRPSGRPNFLELSVDEQGKISLLGNVEYSLRELEERAALRMKDDVESAQGTAALIGSLLGGGYGSSGVLECKGK